jgi:signal transduction histidine kinase
MLHGDAYYTVILRDVTERLRAEEDLRQSRENLHEMASVSSSAREQEKSRIARELHDELAQALTALKMDLGWLKTRGGAEGPQYAAKVAAMDQMLDRTVAATRRISADLRPLMLDDLGLVAAAQWLAQTFRERHGIACELTVDPPEFDLADPHATVTFRIMQESLTNIARHAGASRVEVELRCADGRVTLCVRDDGRGFNPRDPRKPTSYGLVGLRERAYLVDGTIEIDSAPGKGTTIELSIPLPSA